MFYRMIEDGTYLRGANPNSESRYHSTIEQNFTIRSGDSIIPVWKIIFIFGKLYSHLLQRDIKNIVENTVKVHWILKCIYYYMYI